MSHLVQPEPPAPPKKPTVRASDIWVCPKCGEPMVGAHKCRQESPTVMDAVMDALERYIREHKKPVT